MDQNYINLQNILIAKMDECIKGGSGFYCKLSHANIDLDDELFDIKDDTIKSGEIDKTGFCSTCPNIRELEASWRKCSTMASIWRAWGIASDIQSKQASNALELINIYNAITIICNIMSYNDEKRAIEYKNTLNGISAKNENISGYEIASKCLKLISCGDATNPGKMDALQLCINDLLQETADDVIYWMLHFEFSK